MNAMAMLSPQLPQQVMPAPAGFSLHNMLFPDSLNYTAAWTTSACVDLPGVQTLDLLDELLGVHAVDGRTTHPVVAPPNASYPEQQAWEAAYPAGSINPSGGIPGGFGLYMNGPAAFKERLSGAREVLFGYSVMFEDGWEWAKGGKLPGAYGGVGESAYHCTGGRTHDRNSCFNLRLMWRAGGAGELYAYLPLLDDNIARLAGVPPVSQLNPDFGFSVGRGAFSFEAGRWATITERVKLNDVGHNDGEVEIRVNGQTVVNATGLVLRTSDEFYIQGLHFQTFFGGSKADWASPKDQKAWFADVSGAIIA